MTVSLTCKRTPVDGQFGWGGTRLKRYQAAPKVGSGGTENTVECKGKSRPDWISLVRNPEAKAGPNELIVLVDGA